jgi:alkyl hydroperoxide reductase subunit AhpF
MASTLRWMNSAMGSTSDTRAIRVTLVTSPACHLCEDAISGLAEASVGFPLEISVVEIDSEEGRAIVAQHRPPLSPAVLIDGRLFSSGRLPRRKLQRTLKDMI